MTRLEPKPLLSGMTLDAVGLNFIAAHELGPVGDQAGAFMETPNGPIGGFAAIPYTNPAGNAAIGYGDLLHYGKVDPADLATYATPIDQAQADALLSQDTTAAVAAVNADVKVTLSQVQFDAMVDFTDNEGSDAFAKSALRSDLNNNKFGQVPAQLDQWVYGTINGQEEIIPGLVNRRNDEANLFEGHLTQDETGDGPATGFSAGHPGNTFAGVHNRNCSVGSGPTGIGGGVGNLGGGGHHTAGGGGTTPISSLLAAKLLNTLHGYTAYDGYSPFSHSVLNSGSFPYSGSSTVTNGKSAPYGSSPFGYSSPHGSSPFNDYYSITGSAGPGGGEGSGTVGGGGGGGNTGGGGGNTGSGGGHTSGGGGNSSGGGGNTGGGGGNTGGGGDTGGGGNTGGGGGNTGGGNTGGGGGNTGGGYTGGGGGNTGGGGDTGGGGGDTGGGGGDTGGGGSDAIVYQAEVSHAGAGRPIAPGGGYALGIAGGGGYTHGGGGFTYGWAQPIALHGSGGSGMFHGGGGMSNGYDSMADGGDSTGFSPSHGGQSRALSSTQPVLANLLATADVDTVDAQVLAFAPSNPPKQADVSKPQTDDAPDKHELAQKSTLDPPDQNALSKIADSDPLPQNQHATTAAENAGQVAAVGTITQGDRASIELGSTDQPDLAASPNADQRTHSEPVTDVVQSQFARSDPMGPSPSDASATQSRVPWPLS